MGILLNGRLSRSLPRTGFDVQLGTLGPGDIFGDLGMFGLSLQRSFTIRAELASTALVISNSGFMEALDKASDNCRSHQVFSEGFCMKGLLDDAESFLELACFRKLDRNFVLELREASEPRLCYPNQTLMKQGQLGDEMYIIRAGSVRVEKDKKTVVELPSGTVVGELAVLGTDKRRTATVKCQTLCLIRALHADVFHEIVNKFPRAKRIFEHAYVARLVSVDVQNTKEEKLWLDTFFGSAAPLRKTEAAALIGEIDLDEELQKDDSPSSPAERVQQAFRRYPTGRGAHMTGQMTQGQRKSVKMHDLYPNLPSEPMHSEQDDGVPDTDED
jgi:CRP-like cAMP-binding protein